MISRFWAVVRDGEARTAIARPDGPQRRAHRGVRLLEQFEGVEVVTLWMLSTDNLQRDAEELSRLLDIICDAVERLSRVNRWNLRLVGSPELLPDDVRERLTTAIESSAHADAMTVNIAVGYGGRREIIDAVRALLRDQAQRGKTLAEVADELTEADITAHMYTSGQPDPDLVIRTSGEQRLSGFLLWQSAYSEYYFCEAYWPDFRLVDFLRALRAYAYRERRLGK